MKPDHVTLLVSSLERSMPYYEQLLPVLGFYKQSNHVWSDGVGFHCQFLQANADARPYERYGAGGPAVPDSDPPIGRVGTA